MSTVPHAQACSTRYSMGPLGFVATRNQWLARFRDGLDNRALAVEEPRPTVACRPHPEAETTGG